MRQGMLLLNLLLVAGVGLLGQRLISDWRHFQESTRQEVYQRVNQQPEPAEEAAFEAELTQPFNDYLEIHERNLFKPERRPDPVGAGARLSPPRSRRRCPSSRLCTGYPPSGESRGRF